MAPKHVFIDANCLLSFFAHNSDTLNELEKLSAASDKDEIVIYTNDWLVDEIERNRELRIRDSIKLLRENQLIAIPRIAEGLKNFDGLVDLHRQTAKKKQELLDEVIAASEAGELQADKLIKKLLDTSHSVTISDEIYDRAKLRLEKKNPPGKVGALGDRIHWEALLDCVPKETDLLLVTRDKDFCSPVDKSRPNSIIEKEWISENGGALKLHESLSGFLKEHFPAIHMPDDFDRQAAVFALAGSSSFFGTHSSIQMLEKHSNFSLIECEAMLSAAMINSQIYQIRGDSDVRDFFERLIEAYSKMEGANNYLIGAASSMPGSKETTASQEI